MSVKEANPYLFFSGGKADEAIGVYSEALGAEVVGEKLHYGNNEYVPAGNSERIMHAELKIGAARLLLSDRTTDKERDPAGAQHVSVCLQSDDVADTQRKFDALSKHGRVVSPFEKTFWGATFGVIVDKYGIEWMFNCTE